MDPLSTAASIIAVIQLSSEVVQYISTASGATKDRKRLRDEIQACDDILQQLKDEADESEEGKAWSDTINALEAPGAPLSQLWVTLDIVKAKLLHESELKKVVATLKWPFKEKEVEKIISAIEREKSVLGLALTNENRKLAQLIIKSSRENGKQLAELVEAVRYSSNQQSVQYMELNNGVDRLHARQDIRENDEERQNILDWLTSIDYTPQHNDFFHRRQPGTGQWLLDSTEYPGAGKTILTSIIVEDLVARFRNDSNISIAYLYCNFRQQETQNFDDLVSSLLRQLAQGQHSLPESIKDIYNRHKVKWSSPSTEEILRAIESVLITSSRAFIIIDALDECQFSNGCRSRLIAEILRLQSKTGSNFFATSRFIPEIVNEFKEKLWKEIRANKEDVGRYLDGHISQLPKFVSRDKTLQTEIKTRIMEAVDGMFLLAQLHFDSLLGKRSPKAVRKALERLATGTGAYDSAYKDAMERIQGQIDDQEELAKQVLSWIICAKRPLTTRELQHALAVEQNETKLDRTNFSEVEDMISVCAGLVIVDAESEIIRLVHYTAQEYFQRTQDIWFPGAQFDIVSICTTYLSFEDFGTGPCRTDADYEERLQLYPLYDYAARNWGHHGRNASTSPNIVSFLKRRVQVEASSQALLVTKLWKGDSGYSQRVSQQTSGLHLAAYFGLSEAAEIVWDGYNVDVRDSEGRRPLSWAANGGHEAVAKLLLEKGAEVDAKDTINGWTPLSWAANNGHEAVVKLLLEKGAETDAKDTYYGRTPLSWAANNGHEAVVKLLLEKGAEVDTKDTTDGRTPLSWATSDGHKAVVKLLLENGAKVDAKDTTNGRTPLSWAANNGHEAVVKLLLENHAKVDAKDTANGRMPLSWAAGNGHEAVVKLLLEADAKVDAKDTYYGRTPLWWAASDGHKAAVKLLLEKGAKVDAKDTFYGRTSLSWAANNGHAAVVKLLLEKGAEVDAKDPTNGQTPLSWAANNGHEAIVKLLLEKGAEVDSKCTLSGRTPLSCAAGNGHEVIVKLLLEKGAKVNTKRYLLWPDANVVGH